MRTELKNWLKKIVASEPWDEHDLQAWAGEFLAEVNKPDDIDMLDAILNGTKSAPDREVDDVEPITGGKEEKTPFKPNPNAKWLSDPATEKQLNFLKALGYDGPPPKTKQEAGKLIDECKAKKG
jgi:hypothetical protein